MLTFYDSQNNAYELDQQIGRGGEGTVYACDDFNVVAKIYHEPVEDEKAEKLRWMAQNKNEHLLKVAAWVIDVLTDAPGGKVVGFLMPHVKAKEIHELYSLKSRRVHFPQATWHFLVHTAANMARAFYSLHKNAHVMGDVNHGNCVVLADGTVKLIDCDSYSIKAGETRYICEVGVATHVPPELQGADLGEIERVEQHDNFGLAVIIFQLLFLGRHPFSGNYLGAEDKSLEDCIREYRFAYGDGAESRSVRQPPGTLSLSEASPPLANLFERAFLTNEDRPEPREWIEALEHLSNNLEQCAIHPGHHYFNRLAACPWCRIESQTGLMLFPFVSSANGGQEEFNIFTVENLIANLGVSNNLPAKPPITTILPPPQPEIKEAVKATRKREIMIVGGQFAALVLLMALFGVGVSLFIGVILLIFLIIVINNFDKHLRTETNEKLFTARQQWQELENNWTQAFVPKELNDNINRIRAKVGDYQNFQQTNVRRLEKIRAGNRRRVFSKYLHSLKLAGVTVRGVSSKQIEVLESAGIKTAADIEESKLEQLFLVHNDAKRALLEWRGELERNFKVNSENELSEADKKRFSLQTSGERKTIESEIESLLAGVHSGAVYVRNKQQMLVKKSEQIAAELVQSESNSQILGSNSTAIVILLLVTFFPPLIVGSFMNSNSSPKPRLTTVPFRSESSAPGVRAEPDTYRTGSSSESGLNRSGYPATSYADGIDENTTDQQIADLSISERKRYADILYNEAYQLTVNNVSKNGSAENNYETAEQQMRLAVRLNPDIKNLNYLGNILYERAKYEESLVILKRAEKLDGKNLVTKLTIGVNYLQLDKFRDAKNIFAQAVSLDKTSGQGFFNLGLAYNGLNNYKAAAAAFDSAVKINPGDVDAIYELGMSLYNSGSIEGAKSQYRILLKKDTETAEKLRVDANLY